jgi:hypothetical protein
MDLERMGARGRGGIDQPFHVGKVASPGSGGRGHVDVFSRGAQAGHRFGEQRELLGIVSPDAPAVGASEAHCVVRTQVGPFPLARGSKACDEFRCGHGKTPESRKRFIFRLS